MNIIKTAISDIINFPKILITIIYVLLGMFLVMNGIKDNSYLYIIIKSVSHIHLIFIFILPPLIMIALNCYKFIYSNDSVDIPSWDKSDLLKYTIITGLLLTLVYYIFIIVSIPALAYIISDNISLDYYLDYDVSTIYVAIFLFFRLLLFMIMIFMLTLILKYKLKSSKIVLYIFLCIIIIFSLGLISMISFSIFDIMHYICDYEYTKSFATLVISNLIFYSITIIGSFLYLKNCNKYTLIEEIKSTDDRFIL